MPTEPTWDDLSYHLATMGIPSDIEESITEKYELDPWRPSPDTESVVVTITKRDAGRLATILGERLAIEEET